MDTLNILLSESLASNTTYGESDVSNSTVVLCWKTSQTEKDRITISLDTAKTKVVTLTLNSIEYDKKVYEPGKIVFRLSCTKGDEYWSELPKVLKTAFLDKKVCMYTVTSDSTTLKMAHNYYIHAITFHKGLEKGISANGYELVDKTVCYVEVTCYSPDYKLKLKKFSKAWSKIKLSDIFKSNIKDPAISDLWSKTVQPTVKSLSYLNYKGKDPNDKNKEITQELLHPYLVQYNESFYDFLVRVTSRSGEFMFYEKQESEQDGYLQLGLLPKDKNTVVLPSDLIINYHNVENKVNTIDIGQYANDYSSKAKPDGNRSSKKITNYPSINSELTAEDYFREIGDGDTPKFNEIISWWEFVSCFGAGFQAEQCEEFLTNMIEDVSNNLISAVLAWTDAKAKFNKGYIKKEEVKTLCTKTEKYEDNISNGKLYSIADYMKAARDNMVEIDTKSLVANCRLGNTIEVANVEGNKKEHVVTRMHGKLGQKFVQELKKETQKVDLNITDRQGNKITIDIDVNTLKYVEKPTCQHYIEAVPYQETVATPPAIDQPPFRTAQPMVAIVKNTDDPLLLGRVKVKFPWQDNDNLSPWLRVAVPFSGGKGGFNMTLEKGEQVMVNFISGNVECPYVEGSLFHIDSKPSTGWVALKSKYFLPDYKARVLASASGHSITFLDGKGVNGFVGSLIPPAGQIWNFAKGIDILRKEKDDNSAWQKDADEKTLFGGIVLRDYNGIYEINCSTQGRSISINSPLGKVDINAFTGITISAPNGDVKIKGKNVSIEAGNNFTVTTGKNIRGEKYDFGTEASKALGSIIGNIAKNAAVNASKQFLANFDPTKVTDLSFIRSMWEVIMRPVEGTLKLNSNRHMMMTAGKGKVTTPANIVAGPTVKNYIDFKHNYKTAFFTMNYENGSSPKFLASQVGQIKDVVYNFCKGMDDANVSIAKKIAALLEKHGEINNNNVQNLITFLDCIGLIKNNDTDEAPSKNNFKNNNIEFPVQQQANFDQFYKQCKNLDKEFKALKKIYTYATLKDRITDIRGVDSKKFPNIDDIVVETTLAEEGAGAKLEFKFNGNKTPENVAKTIIYKYVNELGAASGEGAYSDYGFKIDKTLEIENDNVENQVGVKWANWADSIDAAPNSKKGTESPFWSNIANNTLPLLTGGAFTYDTEKGNGAKTFESIQKLFNINGCSGPRALWDIGSEGEIMISNASGKMARLKRDGNWDRVDVPSPEGLSDYLKNLFVE